MDSLTKKMKIIKQNFCKRFLPSLNVAMDNSWIAEHKLKGLSEKFFLFMCSN